MGHCKLDHLSSKQVVGLAVQCFHWLYMERDIDVVITKHCWCIKQVAHMVKALHHCRISYLPNPSSMCRLIFYILMYLEKSAGVFQYILLIMDHFTKLAQTLATTKRQVLISCTMILFCLASLDLLTVISEGRLDMM